MKVLLKVFLSVMIFFMIIAIAIFIYFKTREIPKIEFEEINLSEITDGTYIGGYETEFVKAVVEVKVKDHQIIDITITKHENGLGKKAEKIIDEIILKQTLDVDAISGATESSQVIKKAIEQALIHPIQVE